MLRAIVKFLDFIIGYLLAGAFLFVIGASLVLSRFRKERRGDIRNIIQLYISIVDFQHSVISTIKEDVVLGGFIKKALCYHFDFERIEDERVYINEFICMNNVSVHSDNAFTRTGFRRTAAYLVEIKTFFMMLYTALKENVNIIRAHDPHLLGFNAYVLSRLVKAPFIIQICSNYELKDRSAKGLTFKPFLFKTIERWFERAIMRAADTVLTDREHYRAFGLIPKDIPDERYANVGFFVNEAHYSPPDSRRDLRNELGIQADTKVLLYVGRLTEVKHPLDLLEMLDKILMKRHDIVLLVVGDGNLKADMERIAEEKGIKDRVLFIKKLSQDKLKDIYHTADIACFTSAGFTMIEAALAEKCIVAYDFEWHSEFIGRNERGALVPFGDCNGFAGVVLGLLEDAKARARLGREARAYALTNYSRKDCIAKEIKCYRDIFTKRGLRA